MYADKAMGSVENSAAEVILVGTRGLDAVQKNR